MASGQRNIAKLSCSFLSVLSPASPVLWCSRSPRLGCSRSKAMFPLLTPVTDMRIINSQTTRICFNYQLDAELALSNERCLAVRDYSLLTIRRTKNPAPKVNFPSVMAYVSPSTRFLRSQLTGPRPILGARSAARDRNLHLVKGTRPWSAQMVACGSMAATQWVEVDLLEQMPSSRQRCVALRHVIWCSPRASNSP